MPNIHVYPTFGHRIDNAERLVATTGVSRDLAVITGDVELAPSAGGGYDAGGFITAHVGRLARRARVEDGTRIERTGARWFVLDRDGYRAEPRQAYVWAGYRTLRDAAIALANRLVVVATDDLIAAFQSPGDIAPVADAIPTDTFTFVKDATLTTEGAIRLIHALGALPGHDCTIHGNCEAAIARALTAVGS